MMIDFIETKSYLKKSNLNVNVKGSRHGLNTIKGRKSPQNVKKIVRFMFET